MDFLFESIKPDADYNEVCSKVLYQENKDILEEHYDENEFHSLDESTKKKIFSELDLNFKFVLTFGTAITAFFPIVESFIINSGIDDVHLDRSTVVYLGICALAIAFDNPKETYRKLFTELRLRNVYGLLENLTTFIKNMKDLFNYIVSLMGKVTYDMVGIFNYTALFVPFALTLAKILESNNIELNTIVDAMGENGFMKLTTIAIGVTGITLRELVVSLIKGLTTFSFGKVKKYLSKSFSKIKGRVISLVSKMKKSIDPTKVDQDLKSKEIETKVKTTPDILKWSQWKDQNDLPDDVERIDEEK
tara:strand:+ start:1826 stop:2740 length:915 start_codon:yes stop_codon:yes gene_type:complete